MTVGTQLPFDRLVRAVDEWCAGDPAREGGVFAQVGMVGPQNFLPRQFEYAERITPQEFSRKVRSADAIVSHAGMGSIITALTYRKPIVIMPRRADLGEHRNDHQLATARHLADRPGVHVAATEAELGPLLDSLVTRRGSAEMDRLPQYADDGLIGALRDFIRDEDRKAD